MVKEIQKVNDTTVAEIGTEEIRRVYGKTELVNRKASLEEQLLNVNSQIQRRLKL